MVITDVFSDVTTNPSDTLSGIKKPSSRTAPVETTAVCPSDVSVLVIMAVAVRVEVADPVSASVNVARTLVSSVTTDANVDETVTAILPIATPCTTTETVAVPTPAPRTLFPVPIVTTDVLLLWMLLAISSLTASVVALDASNENTVVAVNVVR
jgi:hypothetical protein